jgi:hypothetical protein
MLLNGTMRLFGQGWLWDKSKPMPTADAEGDYQDDTGSQSDSVGTPPLLLCNAPAAPAAPADEDDAQDEHEDSGSEIASESDGEVYHDAAELNEEGQAGPGTGAGAEDAAGEDSYNFNRFKTELRRLAAIHAADKQKKQTNADYENPDEEANQAAVHRLVDYIVKHEQAYTLVGEIMADNDDKKMMRDVQDLLKDCNVLIVAAQKAKSSFCCRIKKRRHLKAH